MRPCNNLEIKTGSDTYWRVQLVCMKVQAHSSLEPPLSGPDAFNESRFVLTFLTILGVQEILWSFRLFLKGKMGKKIPESTRLEFIEKFLAGNFALSDAEYNTFRLLNRGGIVDLLLLRTLLVICWKFWEPNFWKVIDSFVLLAYASLAASKTLLQQFLAVWTLFQI